MTENTAKIASVLLREDSDCHYISVSLHDMLDPKPTDMRTAEEVIENIGNKLQQIGGENT